MIVIASICGLILGLLLNPIKKVTQDRIQEYKKSTENREKTQFYESISDSERFKEAKSIDDFIK